MCQSHVLIIRTHPQEEKFMPEIWTFKRWIISLKKSIKRMRKNKSVHCIAETEVMLYVITTHTMIKIRRPFVVSMRQRNKSESLTRHTHGYKLFKNGKG